MIQYVFECLAFQSLFLVVHDLFLTKETFFQWNRFYLIGTFILSIVLPGVKIEALKTTVSQKFVGYPAFMWELDGMEMSPVAEEANWLTSLPKEYIIFGIGVVFSALWFGYKLFQIYRLKENGTIRYYQDYTKVVVKKSELAFSFFKHIFLGEEIQKENEANIVAHELVHIKQWHSIDLLFFELMRIAFWFNPLVYVYQNRLAELHEFIADNAVAKTNKKEQYQNLLAEAFQTRNISFVNQFFKKSLIKKRIVMLSKEKSKKIYQFKYLLLVPLVLGILVYTSCEVTKDNLYDTENTEVQLKVNEEAIPFAIVDEVPIFPGCEGAEDKKACFQEKMQSHIRKNFNYPKVAQDSNLQGRVSILFIISKDGKIENIIKRGPSEILENEAVRIIELLPQMQPGKQNGQSVDVPFSIPITFRLNPEVKGNYDVLKSYLDLVKQKERLLISVSDTNPGIVKINEQLKELKLKLEEEFSHELINKSKEEEKRITHSDMVPFAVVDEVPIFPGCENASDKKACFQESMRNHIKKHFNYPKEAQELGVQGRVSLVFNISKDGSIKKIRKRGPHELLENEAVRIIERLPQMQPGKQNGNAVDVPFSIPITFKLN